MRYNIIIEYITIITATQKWVDTHKWGSIVLYTYIGNISIVIGICPIGV